MRFSTARSAIRFEAAVRSADGGLTRFARLPLTAAFVLGVALGLLPAPTQAVPLAAHAPAAANDTTAIELDAVIATVDEKPILLSDVEKRLRPKRKLEMTTASRDTEVRAVLDGLILERLIEEEAKRKQVAVNDKDVDDYVDAVAKRNNLTRDSFKDALRVEGIGYDDYRAQVRVELLKARLASSVLKEGISVTDDEVNGYLAERHASQPKGDSVTLRQIIVLTNGRAPEELEARVQEITELLSDGTSFEEVAHKYSDGPQAKEGGLLGSLAEEDLSQEISAAISGLQDGEVSKPVTTAQGVQIFQVVARASKEEQSEDKQREQAREALRQRKREGILSAYFENELYKHHSVDKKI